ncbi:MAG: ThuA domain-containing protein, partial [Planctomycetota bacterium]|nr:ThuA domain-containing protein [Planctomycetota bacterium]
EVSAETVSTQPPRLHLTYQRQDEETERVVEFDRLPVPWAPPELPPTVEEASPQMTEVSGDARHGEQIFFGKVARCGDCHTIHGRGGKLAPVLSALSHRSADSILRDIIEPSAAINPDYLSYSVVLKDGRAMTGTVRAAEAGSLQIAENEIKQTTVSIDAIEQISPNAVSMMPKGLLDSLDESAVQDLLAFLASPPAPAKQEPAFPQRSADEVQAVMASLPATTVKTDSKSIVVTLVAGKQDHGRGEHDYPAWQASWTTLLQAAKGVAVQTAHEWPSPEQWRDSDVLVFYFWNHDWSAERLKQLDEYLARGGGAVVLHSALISDRDPEELAKRWGLAAQPKRTKYRHGPAKLLFETTKAEKENASLLSSGFATLSLVDETYWPMIGDRRKVTVLATAVEDGAEWPMLWTYQPGPGRVWASVIGPYTRTLADLLFKILVLRGLAWAADQPLDRFQHLATE